MTHNLECIAGVGGLSGSRDIDYIEDCFEALAGLVARPGTELLASGRRGCLFHFQNFFWLCHLSETMGRCNRKTIH